MAKRWLRGFSPNTPTADPNVNTAAYALLFYYFLRRCLGYQFIEEQVTGGPTRTFENAHDATASDGAFAGSTLTFTSASNPFAATDVGKFLVLVDNTNEENCGIYPITLYNGPGSVNINFFSSAFPTAASGITWYLVDDGSAVKTTHLPVTNGDYAVLRVNHATYPYEIKCSYRDAYQSNNVVGLVLEFSPEINSWDTGTHAWKSTAPVLSRQIKCSKKYHSGLHSRIYAYGRTEGDILVEFSDQQNNSTKSAAYFAIMDPFETTPARTARERLVVGGTAPASGQGNSARGINDTYDFGSSWSWTEQRWKSLLCYWAGVTILNTSTDYFRQSLGVNARTGERDGFPIWLFADPNSADFMWAPLGQLDSAHIFLGTALAIGNFTTFDSNQYMHILDGVCCPWNGLNQA